MIAPHYKEVQNLTLQITTASASHNANQANEALNRLKTLCEHYEGTEQDHPFQWETLGDLSCTDDEAIKAYQKGFDCAQRIGLPEYAEKIKFAIAETYFDQENILEAHRLASEAANGTNKTNKNALKMAIKVFFGGGSRIYPS